MSEKKRFQNHKFTTLILAIVFAIGIWFSIVYINDPSITLTVSGLKIQYSGEELLREKNLTVIDRYTVPDISVKVSGKRSDLSEFMGDIYAEVNVSAIEGEIDETLPVSVVLPSSRLTLEKKSVDSVDISVRKMLTKTVPLKVVQEGYNKDKIIKSVPSAANVTLTGYEEELKEISCGILLSDVSNIMQDYNEDSVAYVLCNKTDTPVAHADTVTGNIEFTSISHTVYTRTVLPASAVLSTDMQSLYVINSAKTSISPETVEVGTDDSFSGDCVEFLIDRSTTKSETFDYVQAPGLYVPADNLPKITPVLEKKTTKSMTLTLTAKNLSEDLQAEFAQTLTTNIDCGSSADSSNVSAYIDLSAYTEPGAYDVPVTFVGDCISAPSVSVSVTLSAK